MIRSKVVTPSGRTRSRSIASSLSLSPPRPRAVRPDISHRSARSVRLPDRAGSRQESQLRSCWRMPNVVSASTGAIAITMSRFSSASMPRQRVSPFRSAGGDAYWPVRRPWRLRSPHQGSRSLSRGGYRHGTVLRLQHHGKNRVCEIALGSSPLSRSAPNAVSSSASFVTAMSSADSAATWLGFRAMAPHGGGGERRPMLRGPCAQYPPHASHLSTLNQGLLIPR
jgi:hypothetical protein